MGDLHTPKFIEPSRFDLERYPLAKFPLGGYFRGHRVCVHCGKNNKWCWIETIRTLERYLFMFERYAKNYFFLEIT